PASMKSSSAKSCDSRPGRTSSRSHSCLNEEQLREELRRHRPGGNPGSGAVAFEPGQDASMKSSSAKSCDASPRATSPSTRRCLNEEQLREELRLLRESGRGDVLVDASMKSSSAKSCDL